MDGNFPRLGLEHLALDAHHVADVHFLEPGVHVLAHVVPADIKLDGAVGVQQAGEGSLAHDVPGHDTPGEGDGLAFVGVVVSPDLAALTLTSGLKNIGNSLVWVFDELDAGKEYWGTEVSLGLAEGGVGIVTDKNFATYASDATKAAVAAAEEAVLSGAVVVDTAIGANAVDAVALRESVRP